ncbi:MAG: rubrerythrin [Deltaproteobacteria bacterium]|nr:rubrerythrin [Deltaproteobacteria bacterium]MBM4322446.1 rubrerythrin [Deltaproteobacteria bacterium]MBM4347410.1 rubrerythrin [Deltaproteobacteria bacterium]
MDEKKFKEIIKFAIDKEIEAFNFYTEASKNAKYSGGKELFLSLAKEEEGHRKLLENLKKEKVSQKSIEKVPDLHISDYMVEMKMKPDLSYADTLRIAMKREEKSLKLYNDMKESNTDKDLKKLFTLLANEEAKHKLKLEKIYDDEILK